MASLALLLPQAEGLLPKWIGLVGAIALLNGVTSYTSNAGTIQVYNKAIPQVSPVANRLFGTWTFTNGIIRLYAAYNLGNPDLYKLVMWSFGIAWAHFMSEFFVFRSFELGRASTPPMVISTASLIWMWLQHDFYLG